jgi:gluconate 5-dehydrogenase
MHSGMSGRRALVTGSTSGMGYAVAKRLAKGGAIIVLHGRTDAHVEEAIQRLRSEVDNARVS